jgi:prepilin-type N-terminal cleavage/methylation domain-containing protein
VKTRGFTLIELMISMALFGLIASGAMTLVLSAARSQAHSARVDVAQSALRAGIDFITRDVMMTGGGAQNGVIVIPGGATVNAVRFDVAANDSTSAPDTLELWLTDGSPAAQLSSAVAAGATTLPISYEQGATRSFSATTTPFQSYVQLSDANFNSAIVVALSNVSGNTLTIGALPSGFAANAWVLPSKHVVYSVSTTQFANIGNVATNNTSVLMMTVNGTAQPLAEGVEDLQIAYGFDTDGNGVLTDNGSSSDEWLYNNAADTAGSFTIGQLRAIRITIVAKSTVVDTGAQTYGARPAAEDRAAGSSDGFVRRVLRTEIAVRNFNL